MTPLFATNARVFLRPLIPGLALAVVFAAGGKVMAANERERGWGSAWSVPHSEEERVAREQSDRLEKAVRAQDWATVAKTLRGLRTDYSELVRTALAPGICRPPSPSLFRGNYLL